MARQFMIFRVEGDTKPDIIVEYEGVDIDGYTIKLKVLRDSDKCREEYDAVIDDAAAGLFHFEFTAGDLVIQRGRYDAEIEFVLGTDITTFPRENTLLIETRADVK